MHLAPLTALVVDDEPPALSELCWLLGRDHRIGEVFTADSGTRALAVLDTEDIDVVISDISMPGLDGMALARVVAKFAGTRPQIVFVTAHDRHAVDAFAIAATDYVMKPVREERLAEAIRRVVQKAADRIGPDLPPEGGAAGTAGTAGTVTPEVAGRTAPDETIPVELGGVTRFIQRSQVRFALAQGDYIRLHTDTGSHLVRIPLAVLEKSWRDAGFVRIHRSTLVALPHVTEVRMDQGRCSVVVGAIELQVSRRHTKALRDLLLRRPVTGPPPGPAQL